MSSAHSGYQVGVSGEREVQPQKNGIWRTRPPCSLHSRTRFRKENFDISGSELVLEVELQSQLWPQKELPSLERRAGNMGLWGTSAGTARPLPCLPGRLRWSDQVQGNPGGSPVSSPTAPGRHPSKGLPGSCSVHLRSTWSPALPRPRAREPGLASHTRNGSTDGGPWLPTWLFLREAESSPCSRLSTGGMSGL